jgi:hypothetical protein
MHQQWWTSRDGLLWDRPARGVNALAVFPQIPRLETHTLIINGSICYCGAAGTLSRKRLMIVSWKRCWSVGELRRILQPDPRPQIEVMSLQPGVEFV